jgi:exodeoxyribonuclease-3
MKIATWNVNSIRARHERLLRWLERHAPDVLCLQELKVADSEFPFDALRAAGWQAAVHGQRTYNGVAILARTPPEDVRLGLGDDVDDPQARLVAARVQGVRVLSAYVPNGGDLGSEKWAYKLAWLGRLRAYLARHYRPDEPLALCGDFNVAPEARDVSDPVAWERTVLYHPEARAALAEVAAWGLVDAFRLQRDEPGLYSWWDYRMLAFPKNNGLRIDHVYVTAALAARASHASIDRDERKGQQPSDHAPVIVEFT